MYILHGVKHPKLKCMDEKAAQDMASALMRKGFMSKTIDMDHKDFERLVFLPNDYFWLRSWELSDIYASSMVFSRMRGAILQSPLNDKLKCAKRLRQYGCLVPEAEKIIDTHSKTAYQQACVFLEKHRIVYVKPNIGSCSAGVFRVTDRSSLERAWFAFQHESHRGLEMLVEQGCEGSEYSVGVLNGQALTPLLIDHDAGFFDSEVKYFSPSYTATPVRHTNALSALQEIAERAVYALGLMNPARVDIRGDGDRFCVIEVNPDPDMRKNGLLAKSARFSDLAYENMVEHVWLRFLQTRSEDKKRA